MIKKLMIGIVLVALIVAGSLFAQDEPGNSDQPTQGAIDYNDKTAVNELSPADLATAIEQGKITDFSIITDENLAKALNEKISLMDKPAVFETVNQRVQNDPNLLNNNADIKIKWFKHYGVTDEGTKISSYDGTNVKTDGAKSTTFAVKDFPGAKVMKDGSLILSGGHEVSGTSKLYFKDAAVHMEGGRLVTKKFDFYIAVKNGEVKKETGGGRFIEYKGSFEFYEDNKGSHFSSADERGFTRKTRESSYGADLLTSSITIKGDILDPVNSKDGNFIIEKDAEITGNLDFSKIIIKSNSQVYYTQEGDSFCKSGFSCITRNANLNRFKFNRIENNDNIIFISSAYVSKVEADNIKSGKGVYVSIGDKESDKVRIDFEKDGVINPQGTLKKAKVGSIDLIYTKDQKQMRSHYSNTHSQPKVVADYFQKARTDYLEGIAKGESAFVTCEVGTCAKTFAENFGKIVGPKNKEPKTTIVVGGDFISTIASKQMMDYCQKEGCYILNSREMPSEVTTDNLLITGHKAPRDNMIWRKNPDQPRYGDYLTLTDLPEKKSAGKLNLFFSTCNSALEPKTGEQNKVFITLKQKYGDSLGNIFGWRGTSPKTDTGIVEQLKANDIIAYQRPDKKGFISGYVWKEKSPPKFPSAGYYWMKDQTSTPVLVKSG